MKFTCLPNILTIGDMEFDPCWALRAHSSNNIELLHVISGRLELVWEESGECFTAEAGQTLLNPSGIMHRDNFDFDSGLQILIIHFSWEHFTEFFATVNNSNINNLCDSTLAQMKRLFDDIKLDSGPGENDRQLVGARLMHILMLFYREQAPEDYAANELSNTEQCRHRIVAAAKKYLDKNYHHPVRLEDVANDLGISPFYLSRIFSSQSDFSLFQYLTDIRMNEAKKLLRENRHIINDIASMVGFESLSYFSKVFKKHVGCAPSQYGKIQYR
jgi:AraC-like DNA-binding protein